MGHPSLWGWSDFQKLKGLPSAAVSTSASSSGVTLVAMVLARRTARASPLGEAEDCKGAGMRGVLMGKRSSRSACTQQFSPSSGRLRKVLVCHGVYATRAFRCTRVYPRKHVASVSELQTVKLLILSELTLVDTALDARLPAASLLGVTCRRYTRRKAACSSG